MEYPSIATFFPMRSEALRELVDRLHQVSRGFQQGNHPIFPRQVPAAHSYKEAFLSHFFPELRNSGLVSVVQQEATVVLHHFVSVHGLVQCIDIFDKIGRDHGGEFFSP